ncbi:hypothetical protein BDQ17DRAFT_268142 [Cyathus striatus]|nr:hypothetical protein BDQ17DRAFT_268142 [Cyathus striatus]
MLSWLLWTYTPTICLGRYLATAATPCTPPCLPQPAKKTKTPSKQNSTLTPHPLSPPHYHSPTTTSSSLPFSPKPKHYRPKLLSTRQRCKRE